MGKILGKLGTSEVMDWILKFERSITEQKLNNAWQIFRDITKFQNRGRLSVYYVFCVIINFNMNIAEKGCDIQASLWHQAISAWIHSENEMEILLTQE